MNRLSIIDCQPFFEHYLEGILTTGLIEPLQGFKSIDPSVNSAIRTWAKALISGLSYEASLAAMSPQFPACVENLLCIASSRSVLDQAVRDIINVSSENHSELDRVESITRLINQYVSSPINGIVCEGCFEKECVKILARASLEEANEVILEQDGESYFHQKYVGVKLVHIIEPCHSMVFHSIQKKLSDSVSCGVFELVGMNQSFSIEKMDRNRYEIKNNQLSLIFSFR